MSARYRRGPDRLEDGASLIALDVDGTILLEDETPSPGVIDAIHAVIDAGNEVMLATGRSWESVVHIQELLGIKPLFAVCANGATIHRRRDDGTYERFHTETFDPSQVLQLLRSHLPDAHYMVELADGRRLYTETMDYWRLAEQDRVEFEDLSAEPVCRIVVASNEHDESDFSAIISEVGLNEVSYAIGWSAWLDIAPGGVDKGSGLAHVEHWLDLDPARVVVVGDGRNDIGMFERTARLGGRAIAMGQAPREVKEAANEETRSVVDGGLTDVLRGIAARV